MRLCRPARAPIDAPEDGRVSQDGLGPLRPLAQVFEHRVARVNGLRQCLAGSPTGARRGPDRGAALLEVIVALALFVATAAIVTSALSASLASLVRQRRSTHAANLAASVLAELQLGIRSAAGGTGAQSFEPPFEQWTWETVVTPTENDIGETSSLSRVEVIIRHKSSETVRRLAQLIALDRTRRPTTPTPRI